MCGRRRDPSTNTRTPTSGSSRCARGTPPRWPSDPTETVSTVTPSQRQLPPRRERRGPRPAVIVRRASTIHSPGILLRARRRSADGENGPWRSCGPAPHRTAAYLPSWCSTCTPGLHRQPTRTRSRAPPASLVLMAARTLLQRPRGTCHGLDPDDRHGNTGTHLPTEECGETGTKWGSDTGEEHQRRTPLTRPSPSAVTYPSPAWNSCRRKAPRLRRQRADGQHQSPG